MKPIKETFVKDSYTFTQVKRNGEVALFEKSMVSKPDQKWLEVVKLVEDDELDEEVFPASSSFGILGFTFPDTEKDKAEEKFQALAIEFGGEPSDIVNEGEPDVPSVETTAILTDTPIEVVAEAATAKTAHILPVNPPKSPKVPKTPKVKGPPKVRGRKRFAVELDIPTSGSFTARELANSSGQSVPFVHNRLKALRENGEIIEIDRVQGARGKATIRFKKANS